MKLWAASVGWTYFVVRAATAEEAQAMAEARAEEIGCEESPEKPWELIVSGDSGIVAEFIG